LVPHEGQVPLIAGLRFFRVTFFGLLISTFFLHLKQYACATEYYLLPSQLKFYLLYTACQDSFRMPGLLLGYEAQHGYETAFLTIGPAIRLNRRRILFQSY